MEVHANRIAPQRGKAPRVVQTLKIDIKRQHRRNCGKERKVKGNEKTIFGLWL